LYYTCHGKCIFADPLQMSHASQRLKLLQNPPVLHTFDKVHNPLRLPLETTSECPKVFRTCQFFALLTWKCASHHNSVHFFDISTSKIGPRIVCSALDILTRKCASHHNGVNFFDMSTSKSGPTLRCFVHFDLDMYFAPQWRATFDLSSGQVAPHPPL